MESGGEQRDSGLHSLDSELCSLHSGGWSGAFYHSTCFCGVIACNFLLQVNGLFNGCGI